MKHILKPWKENEELSIEDALKELENYKTPTQEIQLTKFPRPTVKDIKLVPGYKHYIFDFIGLETPEGTGDYQIDGIIHPLNGEGIAIVPQNVSKSIMPIWLDYATRSVAYDLKDDHRYISNIELLRKKIWIPKIGKQFASSTFIKFGEDSVHTIFNKLQDIYRSRTVNFDLDSKLEPPGIVTNTQKVYNSLIYESATSRIADVLRWSVGDDIQSFTIALPESPGETYIAGFRFGKMNCEFNLRLDQNDHHFCSTVKKL